MKDLIKAQNNMLRDMFIHEAPEDNTPTKDGPPKPQKLKINIPESPFEPDASEIINKLKKVLKQWQVKEYPSDEIRWKSYYKDILKLVKHLDGNN